MFYQFPEQQGQMNGSEWLNYGGHRLWHSPQVRFRPNQPDNTPVSWGMDGRTLWILGNTEEKTLVQKRLELTMAEDEPSVRVRHAIINRSMWPVELATWALSVMQPEGVALLPVPVTPDGAFYAWVDCSAHTDDSSRFTDELLEHIAGGVFDQEAIEWTRENFGRLKRYGVSLPDALEMLGEGSTDYEEVLRYVEENWDNL